MTIAVTAALQCKRNISAYLDFGLFYCGIFGARAGPHLLAGAKHQPRDGILITLRTCEAVHFVPAGSMLSIDSQQSFGCKH
jgi:hypothetical protein